MLSLACLPIVALILFSFASMGNGLRASLVRGATCWGVVIFALTETLSALHCLTSSGLAIAWLLVNICAAVYLRHVAGNGREHLGIILAGLRKVRGELDLTWFVFLFGICSILVFVGVTALIYPPNTEDAMVYHMPRIVHWLHDRSVGFYTTAEFRQLKMPPWAEFAMLQFHGSTGGDRFDNLVQWFAMFGSVAGVSLIAQKLGATFRGQVFAALICATIIQGLLEASGAKNDYVVGFWLVALVYYLLAYQEDSTLTNALGIGASLGLACLTKTTAFVFAPPLMLAITAMHWRRYSPWRPHLGHILVLTVAAVSLNSFHFVRNYRLFGVPLGPSAEVPPNHFVYVNNRFSPRVTLSNAVRNIALHIGTKPQERNDRATIVITRFLAWFGVDANDPGTTWENTEFRVPGPTLHEGGAGNPLDVILILVSLGILTWRARIAEMRSSVWLSAGLIVAFLLFCTVLRWQPWHTRLHLPLFLLWSAVVATVLTKSLPRWTNSLIGILLLLNSIPALFNNVIRPLNLEAISQPRSALYFQDNRQNLLQPYTALANFITAQHCSEIGIANGSGLFQYPLFALLDDLSGKRNIREVGVSNASVAYDRAENTPPCVILCPHCDGAANNLSAHFASAAMFGDTTVFTSPCPRRTSNSFSYNGWYDQETDGSNWWRWSAGKGQVHILVDKPGEITLNGELGSIQPPNVTNILLNGINLTQILSDSSLPSPIGPLHVRVKTGDNVIEFASRNAGIQPPGDSRVLAIEIRNLRQEAETARGCLPE